MASRTRRVRTRSLDSPVNSLVDELSAPLLSSGPGSAELNRHSAAPPIEEPQAKSDTKGDIKEDGTQRRQDGQSRASNQQEDPRPVVSKTTDSLSMDVVLKLLSAIKIEQPSTSSDAGSRLNLQPSVFEGDSSKEDVHEWLKRYEYISGVNAWNQARRCQVLPAYLSKAALSWYEQLSKVYQSSWDLLKEEMLKTFRPMWYITDAESKLHNRKQGLKESVDSYAFAIADLITKVDPEMPDTKRVSHFVRGLTDELRKFVMPQRPATWSAALDAAKLCEYAQTPTPTVAVAGTVATPATTYIRSQQVDDPHEDFMTRGYETDRAEVNFVSANRSFDQPTRSASVSNYYSGSSGQHGRDWQSRRLSRDDGEHTLTLETIIREIKELKSDLVALKPPPRSFNNNGHYNGRSNNYSGRSPSTFENGNSYNGSFGGRSNHDRSPSYSDNGNSSFNGNDNSRFSRSARTTDGRVVCIRCHQVGHISYNCPERSSAGQVQGSNSRSQSPSPVSPSHGRDTFTGPQASYPTGKNVRFNDGAPTAEVRPSSTNSKFSSGSGSKLAGSFRPSNGGVDQSDRPNLGRVIRSITTVHPPAQVSRGNSVSNNISVPPLRCVDEAMMNSADDHNLTCIPPLRCVDVAMMKTASDHSLSLIIEGVIEGTPVEPGIVVDTGCMLTSVSESDIFDRLPTERRQLLRPIKSGMRVESASGEVMPVLGTVSVELKLPNAPPLTEVDVLVIRGLSNPVLLGLDVLKRMNAVIDLEAYCLNVNVPAAVVDQGDQSAVPPMVSIPFRRMAKRSIRNTTLKISGADGPDESYNVDSRVDLTQGIPLFHMALDVLIPPKSLKQIQCSILPEFYREIKRTMDTDQPWLLAPNCKLVINRGLHIPNCLISVQDKGVVHLAVMNSQNCPVLIPRHIEMGKLELCEERWETAAVRASNKNNTVKINQVVTAFGVGQDVEAYEGKYEVNTDAEQDLSEIPQISAADAGIDPLACINLSDADLDPEDKHQLMAVLQDFRDVFAVNPKAPEIARVTPHYINTGSHPPIHTHAYRVPQAQEEIIRGHIREMEDARIIRPSVSPWAFPVVLVGKKDGSVRFCVDYRRLNAITKKDVYPLPRIDETLEALGRARYFSSLDLASGYWQIAMADEDREKTAFITRYGLYEFNVMPFGLCNAPSTFQRAMDLVLSGLKWEFAQVYLDDILIYSPDFESHLDHLRALFSRLREHGLQAKASKCQFARKELAFLGHVISKSGIKPDEAKLKSIAEYPVPKNVSELRAFLGIAGYYRRFVQSFATVASPLTALLKKQTIYRWTPDAQESFEGLKARLISHPILRCPDYQLPFILYTDASNTGLGAILSQQDPVDKAEYVVCYASRTMNPAERNYSTTERECLGIVWAIANFRPYLYGRSFTVVTDHHALKWLMSIKDPSGRLARWSLRLQEYQFEIIHRKGVNHANADALSRMPPLDGDGGSSISVIRALKVARKKKPTTSKRTYVVQAITDIRFNNELQREEYLVEWIGYPGEDTWEPLENLTSCLEKLAEFRKDAKYREFMAAHRPTSDELDAEDESDPEQNGEDLPNAEKHAWSRFSMEDIAVEQGLDEEISVIRNYLIDQSALGLENLTPAELSRFILTMQSFTLDTEHNIVYRVWYPLNGKRRMDVRKQLYVPRVFRRDVLALQHDGLMSGHYGTKRTFDRIRDRFFWPTMYADTEKWVKSCEDCNSKKTPARRASIPIQEMTVPNRPFEQVSMDFTGPYPKTTRGNASILVITDRFSKWVEAYPVDSTDENTVAKVFVEQFITRHGCPDRVLTDRGANFLSKVMYEVYSLLDIHKLNTTAYHPETNGQTERFNHTLLTTLSMYCAFDQKDWDQFISFAVFAYNTAYNETIQEMPFYVVYGREPRMPMDMLLRLPGDSYPSISEYVSQTAQNFRTAYKSVREKLNDVNSARALANQNGQSILEFKTGDKFWLFVPELNRSKDMKRSHKLAHLWKGPCTVLERVSPVNYRVDLNDIDALLPSRMHNVVHVSRMKPYVERLQEDE